MSAAAQPAALPRTASTRRQPPPVAYNGTPDRDRPHRSQSTSHRSHPSSDSPRRSASASQSGPSAPSHNRTPSNNLQHVQRQDYEQTNLAHPASSRRSESRDRPMAAPPPARVDSRRDASGHARTQSRYNEQPTPASSARGTAATEQSRSTTATGNPQNLRRRTTIDATTGHWELGKTIGAGSMGKVKLARNKATGEQVAVKIVPRHSTEGEHRSAADRERADHSKEVRTAREAAIVTLVDHPYICGMRDVVRTNYHWYMLFEYVNGGQMLDYIISHGRLKEKQARKFGRQIASALDYCHRNSIVHRDLKIENILISKTGDIKIIDFGLSNLFSPRSHLKTFCGSLYFAAPELLQAKQYTGPEVDVWSFGIVLYVLVCGKVPFDDQSMPQLHAKIKKGFVEYPPWLSPECRGLIARMLTTDPTQRATLQEIIYHPWMNKGFNGPTDNYLPHRKPLQMPLDAGVIEKMTGFDFGPADVITSQLTQIMESEDYHRALKYAEKRSAQPPPDPERKRGVFDFYKRRSSINSRDTLNTPSTEAVQLGQDPVNAFHPLMSIYYLAQEKQAREAREQNPGGLAMPQSAGEAPLKVPDLPAAPEAAYTNAHTMEMAGERPSGGRSRPRARTHGEDDVAGRIQNLNVNAAPNPTIVEPEQQASQPMKKEGGAVGLLRRFSTRRHRDSPPERSEKPSHPPSALAAYGNMESPRNFPRGHSRERNPSASGIRAEPSPGSKPGWLTPPSAGDGSSEKSATKKSHGLGRSVSVNSSDIRRRFTRRGASESSSSRTQMAAAMERQGREGAYDGSRRDEALSDAEHTTTTRAQAVGGASRTKSLGHGRKDSMQARRARRDIARTSDVPEETDAELQDDLDADAHGGGSPTGMKPVYLKGLFSVSTTSSRPLPVIRTDIIRVLKQLGIEYREIRGGFSCRHAPSIMPQPSADETAPSGAVPMSPNSQQRKISLSRLRGPADSPSSQPHSSTSSRPPTHRVRDSTHSAQQQHYTAAAPTTTASEEDSDDDPRRPSTTFRSQQRPAGETSTHVQSDLGGNLALRFEILLVKVPLLSLHGIQFKKVDGGTWQYKNMAQTILDELRL